MTRNEKFYWWVIMGLLCLNYIVLHRCYWSGGCHFSQRNFMKYIISNRLQPGEYEEILHQQRLEIEKEMEDYPYDTLSGRNIRQLSDLIIERGGAPFRSVIVSTWRSGSTFLGELVSTHPASFYYYEPMLDLGYFRTPLPSQKPLDIVESLLKCNFSNIDYYLAARKTFKWRPDDHNRYMRKQCHKNESICHKPQFSTRFCRLFPFQVMKIVALDLASMDYFLKNNNLGVKIVFLVRDPRAVMNSRKDLVWCKKFPNCRNLALVCLNMMSDYLTAIDFSKKYPETFKVLRYEDLCSDPWNLSRKIYSFYGIHFHEDVKKFINTHTSTSEIADGDPYSTFRNSKVAASQWKETLTFNEVNKIQENCREAMNVWGYELATNSEHQRTFNPVKPLSSENINLFK